MNISEGAGLDGRKKNTPRIHGQVDYWTMPRKFIQSLSEWIYYGANTVRHRNCRLRWTPTWENNSLVELNIDSTLHVCTCLWCMCYMHRCTWIKFSPNRKAVYILRYQIEIACTLQAQREGSDKDGQQAEKNVIMILFWWILMLARSCSIPLCHFLMDKWSWGNATQQGLHLHPAWLNVS